MAFYWRESNRCVPLLTSYSISPPSQERATPMLDVHVFEYLRDHPGTPQEGLPGILYWPLFTKRPRKAAWTTAEHTDVLSLMPRAEVSEIMDGYARLDYAWETYQPVIASLTQCTAYFAQTSDISTLSPAAVVAEIELIKQTMAREAVYGNTLSALGRQPETGETTFEMYTAPVPNAGGSNNPPPVTH
jgi:hypothetical protein